MAYLKHFTTYSSYVNGIITLAHRVLTVVATVIERIQVSKAAHQLGQLKI